jgi:hypothetical protein
MNGIIYLADYKISEQDFLASKNLFTFRISNLQDLHKVDLSELRHGRFLLRGSKLKQMQFETLFHILKNNEVNLFTDITSFISINNFSNHYGIIRNFAPKSMIFERGTPVNEISQNLLREHFSSPLFLRSEIESAAKYVGVKGCIINQILNTELETTICNLETHVKGFNSLIIKETVDLKKNDNKTFEFRCVVVHNRVIFFDNNESKSGLILTNDVIAFAKKVASHNFECGIRGAYFLDLGVKTDDSIIIIEMKDFINGTVSNLDELAKGLSKFFNVSP